MSNANHNESMGGHALSPLPSREVFASFLYPLPPGEGIDGISLAVNRGQMLFGRKFSQEVLRMLSCVVTAVSLGTEEGGP
jgi:hypothetical protein